MHSSGYDAAHLPPEGGGGGGGGRGPTLGRQAKPRTGCSFPMIAKNVAGAGRLPNAERFRGSRSAREVTPDRVASVDGRMG